MVLVTVGELGVSTQRALADSLAVTEPSMSRMAAGLAETGMLTVVPHSDVVAEVLGSLRRVTPYTIVSADVLTAQLERVRRDGYATTADEMSVGASSVAVPVLRHGTEVVAAVGIVVAQLRRDRGRLVAGLRVAAQGIGRVLDQAAAR